MPGLAAICLYDEGTAPTLDAAAVADYLAEWTGCAALVRGPFLIEHGAAEARPELAQRIARLKVRAVDSPPQEAEPSYGEIQFERRRLANQDRGPFGVLYDGLGFQLLLRELLPKEELRLDRLHIAFTNRTIATWDEDDRRYHLRTVILGLPAIISTTGLVEAPAKPREFYLAQQQLGSAMPSEMIHAALKDQFRGQFLDHDDPRMTEVAKGYVMQALVYQLTGEAFCPDPDCRLFNAHWQAELLRAQLGGPPEYCPRHTLLLRRPR